MNDAGPSKTLRQKQKEHIAEVLRATNANLEETAKALDVSMEKLRRYIRELDIDMCIQ